MSLKRATTLFVCLAATLAVTGCTRRLDMEKLKTVLKDGFTAQTGVALKEVSCPESREIKAGDSFDCKATTAGGATATLKVSQSDDQGNVKWEVSASEGVLDLAKLASTIQAGLKEQAGVEAQVDCGGQFREAEAGKSFDCKATDASGGAHGVTVTVKDKAGNVDWKLAGGGEGAPAEE